MRHIVGEQETRLPADARPEGIPIHIVHVRLHGKVFVACAGKVSWYICFQHPQCGIRILPGADNGVTRFHIPFGTLHCLLGVEGPVELELEYVDSQFRFVPAARLAR